jgi:hypothetical protein
MDLCLDIELLKIMFDKLQRVAQAIQILRLPIIVFGLICLVSIIVIVIAPVSPERERFLIPSLVGLVWSVSTYAFIVIFRSAPEGSDKTLGFIGKIKQKFNLVLYWLISVTFLGATVFFIALTYRFILIWLSEYTG